MKFLNEGFAQLYLNNPLPILNTWFSGQLYIVGRKIQNFTS